MIRNRFRRMRRARALRVVGGVICVPFKRVEVVEPEVECQRRWDICHERTC